jgi:UDP-N-acetylmuramyl pentapeptide phosphotransferase/UDP-N-acetylglucosamine-1-phosphate transferase
VALGGEEDSEATPLNPTIVGLIVFACTFAAALLGMWLRTTLPEHHLDAESRDTVKVGIALTATMTALVLGLVTASAKSSFDVVDTAVKQTATQLLALDRILARYGSETGKIRKGLQDAIGARIDMIWPQGSSKPVNLEVLASGEWLLGTERLADAIHGLTPHDDSQRALQKRALDLAEALLQVRWLVTDSTAASITVPFLAVLLFWLTIIFASFGLFAPRNATVVTVLLVCALSVGSAVFLVLELDGPFDGLLKVSSAPLRYTYVHLNR